MTAVDGVWRFRSLVAGTGVAVVAFVVYVLTSRFDAGRPDLFYLADAFLHGRLWLDHPLGPWDVVALDGRYYVPFAPFPAFVLTPVVAAVGPSGGDFLEGLVDSTLATISLALVWRLAGRVGVASLADRAWLVALFGFSTPIWWVTMRGGVWHTGHLVATIVTLIGILESYRRRRAMVMGVLSGLGFLSRAPLVAALPYWAWRTLPGDLRGSFPRWDSSGLRRAVQSAIVVGVGFAPLLAVGLWYNQARFGNPLESGYGLAALPPFLEAERERGMFALVHLARNLDYLLWHLPELVGTFPWIKPDGLGMSILITSPGLLLVLRANWRDRETIMLGVTAVLVLIPSLLYYGGGWWQFGYRYALDSLPFVIVLCALAAARSSVGWRWRLLIALGICVNAYGIWWSYNPS